MNVDVKWGIQSTKHFLDLVQNVDSLDLVSIIIEIAKIMIKADFFDGIEIAIEQVPEVLWISSESPAFWGNTQVIQEDLHGYATREMMRTPVRIVISTRNAITTKSALFLTGRGGSGITRARATGVFFNPAPFRDVGVIVTAIE